mmetsp:Transcript_4978/g.10274  ORF Transcript_4978/g.10274 Transcript_4978/m.10274 type:complete len:220 (+) Transcript_4978:238-897(+)
MQSKRSGRKSSHRAQHFNAEHVRSEQDILKSAQQTVFPYSSKKRQTKSPRNRTSSSIDESIVSLIVVFVCVCFTLSPSVSLLSGVFFDRRFVRVLIVDLFCFVVLSCANACTCMHMHALVCARTHCGYVGTKSGLTLLISSGMFRTQHPFSRTKSAHFTMSYSIVVVVLVFTTSTVLENSSSVSLSSVCGSLFSSPVVVDAPRGALAASPSFLSSLMSS